MLGEGNLVSNNSLGGSSKHFGAKSRVVNLVRVVQGLGLPGSSSQRKGTEAKVWSGGVSIPEGSGDCMVWIENNGSFGVKLGSGSTSLPMTLSLSLSLSMLFSVVFFFLSSILWRTIRQ